jgi:hypothetical protein
MYDLGFGKLNAYSKEMKLSSCGIFDRIDKSMLNSENCRC